MPKEFPIGTIRHWQDGDVIKAHDPIPPYSSGWIKLSTDQTLDRVGREADSLSSQVLIYHEPINGKDFLDHEIDEFTDEYGEKIFRSGDFKVYQGFYGAGVYAFRNEFSKLFMQDKMALDEAIANAYAEANEEAGGTKNIEKLSKEERKEIRDRVKENFKYEGNSFTVEKARKLVDIIKATVIKIKEGVDFSDENKKRAYDEFKLIADSIPKDYTSLKEKRLDYINGLVLIEENFSDNWGVSKFCKDYMDKKFSEFTNEFSYEIKRDSVADQMNEFGITIDMDTDEFYERIFNKVSSLNEYSYLDSFVGNKIPALINGENGYRLFLLKKDNGDYILESSDGKEINLMAGVSNGDVHFPSVLVEQSNFKELMYLRFQDKFNKTIRGEWNLERLPALHALEKAIQYLPDGHFLTNDLLNVISQENFNGGDHDAYAWYSPTYKAINFSSNCVESASKWADTTDSNEFMAVLFHEIGHAVSNKLGRADSYEYKRFVVDSGWTYQSKELRAGVTATGGDKDIPRTGSNSSVSLFSGYAHKSPEEAFAEHYSMYALHKKEIDLFLNTGNPKFLEKSSKTISFSKPLSKSIRSSVPTRILSRENLPWIIYSHKNTYLSEDGREIKHELVSPWETKYTSAEKARYNPGKIKRRKDVLGISAPPPAVGYRDGGKTVLIDGVNRNEVARMNKKMTPVLVISKEMYNLLNKKGLTDKEISDCVYTDKQNDSLIVQDSIPKKVSGLLFRSEIIDFNKIREAKAGFKSMQKIFNSKELEKALQGDIEKAGHKYIRKELTSSGKWKYIYPTKLGIRYLSSILKITSGKQYDYFKAQLNNAKEVRVIKTNELISADELKRLGRRGFEKKQCYYNAFKVATTIHSKNVKYVEGVVFYMGIPIEHAWNEVDGKYFDVTADYVLKEPNFTNYTSYLELDQLQVSKYSAETGLSGPYFRQWFLENIEKSIIDISIKYLSDEISDSEFCDLINNKSNG